MYTLPLIGFLFSRMRPLGSRNNAARINRDVMTLSM